MFARYLHIPIQNDRANEIKQCFIIALRMSRNRCQYFMRPSCANEGDWSVDNTSSTAGLCYVIVIADILTVNKIQVSSPGVSRSSSILNTGAMLRYRLPSLSEALTCLSLAVKLPLLGCTMYSSNLSLTSADFDFTAALKMFPNIM